MKNFIIYAATFLVSLSAAFAGPVSLKPTNYNFQLAGGGGGSQAKLDGNQVEIFCDDFANEISIGVSYTANVIQLGLNPDLSKTRFGGVTDWVAINLAGNSQTIQNDEAFFNTGAGSSSLARYEMAAYLVSLYNVPQGATTANNELQEAIWTLMDPTGEGAVIDPSGVDPSVDLEHAMDWYQTMNMQANQGALSTFLGNFEVVSDSTMTFRNGRGIGGFQEEIVMTPEPRAAIWLLVLFGIGAFLFQRSRARKMATVQV